MEPDEMDIRMSDKLASELIVSDISRMTAELLEHTAIQEAEYDRIQLAFKREVELKRQADEKLELERKAFNDLHIKPGAIKAIHAALMRLDKSRSPVLEIRFSYKYQDEVEKFLFGIDLGDHGTDSMLYFPDYKISTFPYRSEYVWRAEVLRWITEYLKPTNGKFIATAKYDDNLGNAGHTIYITKTK